MYRLHCHPWLKHCQLEVEIEIWHHCLLETLARQFPWPKGWLLSHLDQNRGVHRQRPFWSGEALQVFVLKIAISPPIFVKENGVLYVILDGFFTQFHPRTKRSRMILYEADFSYDPKLVNCNFASFPEDICCLNNLILYVIFKGHWFPSLCLAQKFCDHSIRKSQSLKMGGGGFERKGVLKVNRQI